MPRCATRRIQPTTHPRLSIVACRTMLAPPITKHTGPSLASALPGTENPRRRLPVNPSPHFPNPLRLLSNRLTPWCLQSYKYSQRHVDYRQHPPLFIKISTRFPLSHSLIRSHSHSVMKTRTKNKSAHPAAPIMTPGQLAAAGIPQPPKRRRQPTKDQRIAALEEDLRAT